MSARAMYQAFENYEKNSTHKNKGWVVECLLLNNTKTPKKLIKGWEWLTDNWKLEDLKVRRFLW